MKHLISSLSLFLLLLSPLCYSQEPGDSISVTHSAGNADGNVYVTVDDPAQLTGHDYEVSFHTQLQIRNKNGDWVPASIIRKNYNPGDPDTLTGTTIDAAAVYGPNSGTTELRFHLDVVHHYYGWVDGVILTFPSNVTIISSPPFEAGGGTVTPEIIGQEIHYGVTDNSGTGNGIFHDGGEDWIVIVSTITPPMTVDWIAFDDGYAGGGPPLEGTTTVTDVGFASRLAKLWNMLDVTIGELALEDISIVNGIDLFPPRDDAPTIVPNPIVDGFQINVDVNYDEPVTYSLISLNGEPLTPDGEPGVPGTLWVDNFWSISDGTFFGLPDGTSLTVRGYGTSSPDILQQDYEFRWTGVEELVNINGQLVYITQDGTGSMATLYGAGNYNISNHPLNPNPGSSNPFLIRIPFELWNKDTGIQINYQFYDRVQSDPFANNFKVWNTDARMYGEILNTAYDPAHIANGEMGGSDSDFYTWNNYWFLSQYQTGDLIETYYFGAIVQGVDEFTFTTPDSVVSVEDESIVTTYELLQNYPNPFNPSTIIKFSIPSSGFATLKIYNALGEEVAELLDKEFSAGVYEVAWNAIGLPSGVYFYALKVEDKFFEVKKMLLLK